MLISAKKKKKEISDDAPVEHVDIQENHSSRHVRDLKEKRSENVCQ